MNAVVIGANGFVGAKLTKALLLRGWNVFAVFNSSVNNIDSLAKKIHFDDYKSIGSDIDVVFYLSGSFQSSHDDLIEINCHQLQLISHFFKTAKLVFLSSANVYGQHDSLIQIDSCFNNPNTYGHSKLVGEFITKNHARYAIVRPCYLYGPNLDNKSFLPQIMYNARKKGEIVLFGNGEREQDYLYIEDVIELCILAYEHKENDIFLAASGNSYSNKFIANLIMSFDPVIKVSYTGSEMGKSLYYNPYSSFDKLRFNNVTPIEIGIKNMWDASADMR